MNYSIFILPSAERDCKGLSKGIYSRCYKAMLGLAVNPRPHGSQKLVGEDGYRLRVGDYRILFRVDDSVKKVFIYRIKHHKEVYR